MGLRKFDIVFDDPRNIYYPGQVVTGRVLLELNNLKKVRSVKITVKGGAKTRWQVHDTRYRSTVNASGTRHYHRENIVRTFSAEEEYFKREYYLLGSASGNQIELPAGEHSYPFSCSLPQYLPSSFEANDGHVRYTIKATFDRPWKFNHETKAGLTVISPFDLNQEPQASKQVQEEMSKTFFSLNCGTSPLTMKVSLPARGYVPGQEIPVKINVDNKSRIAVEKINLKLKKVVTFYGKELGVTKSKITSTVIDEVSSGPVGGVAVAEYVQKLKVPPLPPSNLKYCNIINLEYRLQIEACMSSWFRRNLANSFLLYIGTVPLTAHEMRTTSGTLCTYENQMNSNALGFVTASPSAPMESPTLNIGFDLPPPSYEESMICAGNLWENGDSDHIGGLKTFRPRYPVYDFTAPRRVNEKGCLKKDDFAIPE